MAARQPDEVMTRHLVDPELLEALDAFPPFEVSEATLSGFRSNITALLPPEESYAHPDVAIERRTIAGPAGAPDVPVVLFRPRQAGRAPALLYIHGGGYVLGSAMDVAPGAVRTASELGCLVLSVEYRLAPETRAPGSLEDCYAALKWLHDQASTLGVDPRRIAIGGESAGGGLAAALALLARDRGEYPVCFQLLIYPMLDDRTSASSTLCPNTGEFIWNRDANDFGWRSLLGVDPGDPSVTERQAPARAADLSGLPPAYISVGTLDLFLDENLAYAERLIRAGVETELHVLPGAFHGFEIAFQSGLAQEAQTERRRALKRAFAACLEPTQAS